jgi:hypothetical protein
MCLSRTDYFSALNNEYNNATAQAASDPTKITASESMLKAP